MIIEWLTGYTFIAFVAAIGGSWVVIKWWHIKRRPRDRKQAAWRTDAKGRVQRK